MTAKVASVLIVDDEEDLCESVQFVFDDGNYKTFMANDIDEAFEIVKHETIDFVISDIRMPGGSGLDLLEKIKAECDPPPKVILISGYIDITIKDAMAKGAEDIIRKPIDLSVLFDKIESIRKRQQS